jgi:hypothetical protein
MDICPVKKVNSSNAGAIALAILLCILFSQGNLFAQQQKTDSLPEHSSIIKRQGTTDSLHIATINKADSLKTDTATTSLLKKTVHHSPLKAAMFSAVLPGLGQAYNRHYWKIPIVYAGFAGLGYALYYTSSNFIGYRNAYRAQLANPGSYNPASYNGVSDAGALKDYRDYYKKYMDISAIGIGVWYLLNIVDATVDAHLFEWNMKDDLSVTWHPVVIPSYTPNTASAGIQLTLHF